MPQTNAPDQQAQALPAAGYHGTRRGRGRPTDLTPEVQAEFERLIRAGNFFETVCDFMGLVRDTARRWMREGGKAAKKLARDPEAELSDEEARCLDFFEAIRRANAASEMTDLAVIGTLAAGRPRQVRRTTLPDGTQIEEVTEGLAPNFQAASWRLARKRPRRFGQQAPIRVQHEGTKDGPPVQMEHSGQVTFYLPDNGRGGHAGPLEEPNGDGEAE